MIPLWSCGAPGWVLPGASLDMDFANGVYFGGPVDSLLTTTRASTGYAATSSGLLVPFLSNIPRITDLGLLVEQAATNLFLNSVGFGTGWGGNRGGTTASNGVGTANFAVAPDGTTTATRVQLALNGATTSSDISEWIVTPSVTISNATVYTQGIWIKSNTGSSINMSITDVNNSGSQIVVTTTWTRFTLTATSSGTSANFQLRLRGAQTPVNPDTADISIWGGQLELGSVATSNITTAAVAVTRAIDNEAAATALLTALQSASGTVIMSVGGGVAAAVGTLLGINALIGLGKTAADKLTTAFGGAQTSGNSATWTGNVKVGLRWTPTAVAICLNGGTVVTAANTPPAVTSANIGSTSGSSAAVNQFIKRLTVFTSSVSDASLQALTT